MADFGYDEFVEEAASLPAPQRVKKVTNGAGAAISVALIVGLTVWAYQIAVRDARGVPVVRALEGPMRIAPDDPGGEQVAHQGLAVNRVAAEGEVADPADRLTLAPRPVELTEDDQAGFAPIPPSAVVPTLTATIPIPGQFADEGSSTAALEGDAALVDAEPEAGLTPETFGVTAALPNTEFVRPALAAGLLSGAALAAPQPAVADAVTAALAEAVAAAPLPVVGATDAAVARSLRPVPRPVRAADSVAATPVAAVAVVAAIPSGTRLIQLGAYDDVAAANRDWDRLVIRYSAYFKGKSPVIQQASSGGRRFFRLRAVGFEGEDEARRLCAVLISDQAQCIPVLTR